MTSQQKELECLKSGNTSRTELLKEKKILLYLQLHVVFINRSRRTSNSASKLYIFSRFYGICIYVYVVEHTCNTSAFSI